MRALSSSDILTLWEHGLRMHPLDRGLLALSFAHGAPGESVADWPLGQRNRALLELHASWFGEQMEAWTACPECSEKVEFELDVYSVLTSQSDTGGPATVEVGDHAFRLPTTRDLVHAAVDVEEDEAVSHLLERCRIDEGTASVWTAELVEAAGEQLALADPLSETRVGLICPVCRYEWNDIIDVAAFVWSELEVRGRRLLWEVHCLASAYGWSECETLALSASRRAIYLEMVQA